MSTKGTLRKYPTNTIPSGGPQKILNPPRGDPSCSWSQVRKSSDIKPYCSKQMEDLQQKVARFSRLQKANMRLSTEEASKDTTLLLHHPCFPPNFTTIKGTYLLCQIGGQVMLLSNILQQPLYFGNPNFATKSWPT